jgi:hypothetical protein
MMIQANLVNCDLYCKIIQADQETMKENEVKPMEPGGSEQWGDWGRAFQLTLSWMQTGGQRLTFNLPTL